MKDIVTYGFVCTNKENFMAQILAWLKGIKQCFVPKEMSGLLFGNKFCRYNEQALVDKIQTNIAQNGMVCFTISQEENELTVIA